MEHRIVARDLYKKTVLLQVARCCLEFRRVQESQNPWHGELGHEQKEWAYQGDGHHFVKINQQISTQLRENLNDCGTGNTFTAISLERSRNFTSMTDGGQFFGKTVSIFCGLTTSLSKIGEHGMCRCRSTK
eukprot:scaffold1332_cov166-Amphora_coffeaeformis.AAC.23